MMWLTGLTGSKKINWTALNVADRRFDHSPSSPRVRPFPNGFEELFPRWTCEIKTKQQALPKQAVERLFICSGYHRQFQSKRMFFDTDQNF